VNEREFSVVCYQRVHRSCKAKKSQPGNQPRNSVRVLALFPICGFTLPCLAPVPDLVTSSVVVIIGSVDGLCYICVDSDCLLLRTIANCEYQQSSSESDTLVTLN
jgi:hypothetical protein